MEVETTVHGFRSSFCDWAAERTNYPLEVAESALAYSLKDKPKKRMPKLTYSRSGAG